MIDPQATAPARRTAAQKATRFLKILLCLLSFGFVYPNALND